VTTAGDAGSSLRFTDAWEGHLPDLSGEPVVAQRRGCDLHPIDATSDEGRLTLLSFVWPDQPHRFARLRAALDIADNSPVPIDQDDAGAWVETQLAQRVPGVTTVVFHSIVLPYLSHDSLERMRTALARAGAEATIDAPLAWLRMEPAGVEADLRLTTWPGGGEEILGTTGYHGPPVHWAAGR
jgi:hypothetical protein